MKIQKKKKNLGGGGWVGWDQGGCESRIEVFRKIRGGGMGPGRGVRGGVVLGVRMDVNDELKFL